MYYQSNRDRFRNIGNKSLQVSTFEEPQGLKKSNHSYMSKARTEVSSDLGPDSLQIFQEEINSVISGVKQRKSKAKKTIKTAPLKNHPSSEVLQIKTELSQLKNLLQGQTQLQSMQKKLQHLLIQLELQKSKSKAIQSTYPPVNFGQPNYMQLPQQHIPPNYYYPPPPPHYPQQSYYPPKKKMKMPLQSDEQDDFYPKKSRQTGKRTKRNVINKRQVIRTKLRVYLFVVAYSFFLRSEAKKLSTVRKNNLKKFWSEKFEGQIQNIKNWFLDSQKYSLAIILEKKNLSLLFFNDKSEKVKQQKKKLIMQIITIGINKILESSNQQKISLFSEILLNLCRRGSFSVSRFWTVAQMEQICVSEFFGFFRIDTCQEKFLIGLLVFVKVFIFNMFLQPHKFDSQNFPKNQQPLVTNMKLISSVYYLIIKTIINEYKNEARDSNIYKVGNWLSVKKQFIVECCEPLIFGNSYPEDDQYISGLFNEEQLSQLTLLQSWAPCLEKTKEVIEKLHVQMLNKGKMVKKNLKYKLYN